MDTDMHNPLYCNKHGCLAPVILFQTNSVCFGLTLQCVYITSNRKSAIDWIIMKAATMPSTCETVHCHVCCHCTAICIPGMCMWAVTVRSAPFTCMCTAMCAATCTAFCMCSGSMLPTKAEPKGTPSTGTAAAYLAACGCVCPLLLQQASSV